MNILKFGFKLFLVIILCLITGAIYGFIGSLFDIIPLFQLVVGGLVYTFSLIMVKKIKCSIKAVILTICFGLLTYYSYFNTSFFTFNLDIEESIVEELNINTEDISEEKRSELSTLVDDVSNEYLTKQTGHSGKWGYFLYNAKSSSIFRRGKLYDLEELSFIGYILEFVKMFIIVIIPGYAVYSDFKKQHEEELKVEEV